MSGELRVRAGERLTTFALPHRVVFGRRHAPARQRRIGETHLSLGTDASMSREWFSVEDVQIVSHLDGAPVATSALLVTCRSTQHGLQIWDGGDPVRIDCGGTYLIQGETAFIGHLHGSSMVGARIERLAWVPTPRAREAANPDRAVTVRPPGLDVSPFAQRVLLARYHRYYLSPPGFDPQPVPWAEVATGLGLLSAEDCADGGLLRRATKPAQDAVAAVKHLVDQAYPGWLPAGSQTQKTFHDHLRLVLEMHGFFDPARLAPFEGGC